MSWIMDKQFTEHVLDAVQPEDGGFEIRMDGGICLFVENPAKLPLPKPGQRALLFGDGFGYPVRGVVVEGVVYFYRTEAEQKALQEQQAAERQQELLRGWQDKRSQWDAELAALPEPLRTRIEFFMRQPNAEGLGGWGPTFGGYEMFCCQQAAALAAHLGSAAAVQQYAHLSQEDQKARFPELSMEHSGQTFAMMLRLAYVLHDSPEQIPRLHGALCPLVGCQEYGCWSTTANEAQA